jgi:uncharacterized OsmC-like protein
MNISANIKSRHNHNEVSVETNRDAKTITISPKNTGYGSSINGGELLLLSLATCFCNDLYREANKRGIVIESVEVECLGEFGAAGEPGSDFRYKARVTGNATAEEIDDLIIATDKVAEIHNTLRKGLPITLIR